MSIQKNIKSRVILKHDTEANWRLATNFRPLNGEIIIYDPDETHPLVRYKRGRIDPNNPRQTLLVNDLDFETNIYIAAIEPQESWTGMLWLDTSDEVELISFTMRNIHNGFLVEYVAESGMTFREWVDSPYNIDKWRCEWEYEENPEGEHTYGVTSDKYDSYIMSDSIDINYGIEDCENVIIAGKTYSIEGRP